MLVGVTSVDAYVMAHRDDVRSRIEEAEHCPSWCRELDVDLTSRQ